MNPGNVAPDRNVGSDLVKLASDRQVARICSQISYETEPIVRRLHWRHSKINEPGGFLEPRFKNGHASAGHRGVSRPISRMRRRPFRKSHWQEIRAVACAVELFVVLLDRGECGRTVNRRVNVESARMRAVVFEAASELLGSQPPMHKPLLIPNRLQSARR